MPSRRAVSSPLASTAGRSRATSEAGKTSSKSRGGQKAARGGAPVSLLAPTMRLWFLASLLVLIYGWGISAWNVARPLAAGTDVEFVAQLQAWRNHGSPNLTPDDLREATALAARNGYSNPDATQGFFASPRDGRSYSWHFPAYSAAVAPLRLLIDASRGNGFAAFGVFNALLFFLTFIAACAIARANASPQTLVFWTLCAGSPLLWYLRWPSPEVWTWAALFGALLCLDARRYFAGALLASLAAWPNWPVLFVAWWFVALALADKGRSVRSVAPVAAAAALSFLPNLFYLWLFGRFNLHIAKTGGLDFSLLSPARFAGFLFDLNQGMLLYVPLLLALAVWSVVRAVGARPFDGRALAGFAVLVVMIAASCLNATGNDVSAGMRRDATWMLPLLSWLALRNLNLSAAKPIIFGALAWQLAIVMTHDGRATLRAHAPRTRSVLTQVPAQSQPVRE